MAIEIKVPSVGESITEGTLSRWFKKDGELVKAEEPLYELETEKATTEIPAPATGVLRILVRQGETVAVGTVVGRLEEAGATTTVAPPPKAAPPAASADNAPPQRRPDVALSPAARRLAAQENVDIGTLTSGGQRGAVTKEDVQSFLEQKSPATATQTKIETPTAALVPALAPSALAIEPKPAPRPEGRETRERMSSIRQRIAQRLTEAKNAAAILSTFNEVDMSAVMELRSRYKEAFQKKHGVGLGYLSFFVKACVEALRAFPVVNARIDGTDVVYHHYFNIGVAVSTEKGLMVPVIRDADQLGFAPIEKQIAALAQKARDGKIGINDLQGGTFTITNGGIFGSLLSTPILNPPQSGILGMHAIQKRPVAVDDQVAIRPMMYLALSYDHRLVDGREAVLFLVRIKECIENPERLLLEI